MLYNLRYFIIFNTNKVMKKLFTLLAVVLLTSASAMAQGGNYSPLQGDVNGDGSVDVADIVAVIDLIQKGQGTGEAGYFYLGTTKPTAENFTTLAGAVATYTSIDEAVGTKVSVAAGETLYMLCPTSWTKEKSVALEDEGGETVNFSNKDAATISGYSIYETSAWKASSTATLKIIPSCFWYCGQPVEQGENTVQILENVFIPTINENSIVDETENIYPNPGWRYVQNKKYSTNDKLFSVNYRNGRGIYVGGLIEQNNNYDVSNRLYNEVTYYVLLPILSVYANLDIYVGAGPKPEPIATTVISDIEYKIYKFTGSSFNLDTY